jgi:hypothetical protein
MKSYTYSCIAALALTGCAFEVAYDPDLVAEETPGYIAEAQIIVVMPADRREFVFDGPPSTEVGDFTTLTIPLGQVVQEITTHVFESCFMYGVAFTEALEPGLRYVIAVEPQIGSFSYGFQREPDPRFNLPIEEEHPVTIITPQVEFDLALTAYNSAGEPVLEKVYESGLVSGDSYYTANRPHERINAAFHSALQRTMQTVAEDLRPHLVGQCEITELDGG